MSRPGTNGKYEPAAGFAGGFTTEIDGYLCFILLNEDPSTCRAFPWMWCIQVGGGWTSRGGEKIELLAEGMSPSAVLADQDIAAALETLPA